MDTLRESAMATKTYRSSVSGKSGQQHTATTANPGENEMEMKIIGALNEGVI